MPKSFLRVADLSAADFGLVLDRALAYKSEPGRGATLLRGRSVTLYFNKPSTRTRISFETAVHRLGGLPVTVGPNDLQMGRGETVEDTARVISRYSAAFVTRTYSDGEIARFAAAASIPVINALTDGHHPCQALADLMTLRERFGQLKGLTLTYVGAGNNVVHSLLEASALAGVHMRVATPPEYPADPAIVDAARALAKGSGARIEVMTDPSAAVAGADAIYTDTWLSMGDPDEEKAARQRILAPYRVDAALMAKAKPSAIFLHCLPAHRGEEVTNEVADSPASAIFDQAENKLHTSMAVLDVLVTGALG
ncbi:MAG: ornithine carbamoyltransferase [Polyangiaceae bacterium]|nr:ornithine carbamoyltransferase [Polyangiaceae bacterium]